MFGLIKKTFTGLLPGLLNGLVVVIVSLSIQKRKTQATLINLHPNKFHYYKFAVKLDRCVGSCSTLNDLSNKVCVRNKTEDLNLSVLNMITGINESKNLTKHISCKCKCKFDGRRFNSDQWWNIDKCRCKCKKHNTCEKGYIWSPARYICENGKYVNSIMDESGIICVKVIQPYDEDMKAKSYHETNFNKKEATWATESFYILFVFLLITIAFLINVSIYCYLIKYQKEQKNYYNFTTQN